MLLPLGQHFFIWEKEVQFFEKYDRMKEKQEKVDAYVPTTCGFASPADIG